MRPLALVLFVLGFVGIVFGVLANVLPGAGFLSDTNTEATWGGIGPVFAGVVMIIAGYFLREPRRHL
jgi:hypothetical protein